jgi:hypothetical protein
MKRSKSLAAMVKVGFLLTTSLVLGLPDGSGLLPAFADPGLSYDNDHDVVVLPGCDVAMRYNNKTFVPVKAKLLDADYVPFLKEAPAKAVKVWEDFESAKMKTKPEQIYIENYEIGKIGTFGVSRLSKELLALNRVREVQFTNARVAKETGLSETSFVGILAVKSYEVTPKSGATPYFLYVFQTPKRLTTFARQMRANSREFPLDTEYIVTQLRVCNAGDSISNVKLESPVLTPAPSENQSKGEALNQLPNGEQTRAQSKSTPSS